MCGRFTVTTPIEELIHAFGLEPSAEPVAPRFNVAPTESVAAIVDDAPNRLSLLRWGLIPSWANDDPTSLEPVGPPLADPAQS